MNFSLLAGFVLLAGLLHPGFSCYLPGAAS